MEKENRCFHCEGRLEPGSNSQSCKTCTEVSSPSISEIKRDQVKGEGCLSQAYFSEGPRIDLRVQLIIHFMLLLQMGRIIFLLNMIVDKVLWKEYCHSDAKPSSLRNETGLFSILFYLLYSPPRFEKNVCFLLFQIMERKKGAVLLDIWGESLLSLKCVMVLRFLFSKFKFLYYFIFNFCQQRKIIFFLVGIK